MYAISPGSDLDLNGHRFASRGPGKGNTYNWLLYYRSDTGRVGDVDHLADVYEVGVCNRGVDVEDLVECHAGRGGDGAEGVARDDGHGRDDGAVCLREREAEEGGEGEEGGCETHGG